MEVVVTTSTTIGDSPRKYPSVATPTTASQSITLDKLQNLQNFQRVTVVIKVLRADPKMEVKPGLFKQDLCVSDATGTARLTVWQDTINSLKVEESYKIEGLIVCSFSNQKYLTPPKPGCCITPQADIGAVEDEPEPVDPNSLAAAEVAAVSYIGTYRTCMSCSGKVEPVNDCIGRCTKCDTAL